jgi:CxxC-x17-CxxC domain-containing protein
MFQTVCANCGKDCEVPFRPTGEKPVLCDECFAQERGVSAPRRFDGGRSAGYGNRLPQSGGGDFQKQFDEINSKLESIIEILQSMMNKPAKKKKAVEIKAEPEQMPEPETPVKAMPEEPAVGDLLPQEEES